MEPAADSAVPDESFLERISFVVQFLHQQGFHEAQTALLAELEAKFPGVEKSQNVSTQPSSSQQIGGGVEETVLQHADATLKSPEAPL